MAIPSEWVGLPVSPTLPYLHVSKLCLMPPGLHPNSHHSPGFSCHLALAFSHTYIYIYIYTYIYTQTHTHTHTLDRWGGIWRWMSNLLYCLKTCENSYPQLHYATLLQAEARDPLVHWDGSGQVQTAKLPTTQQTGNNKLPEVHSLFCRFKFIHHYFLGLGVIFSCI